jgi:hypothetical protein
MISGEVLMYLKGLGLVFWERESAPCPPVQAKLP